jgi:hypothetical protein
MGVGVVRGWQIVPVPASGQISNVRAFVLPERMPVADDDRQLPMFGSEDLIRELLEVNRIQAQALFEALRRNGVAPHEQAKPRRPHQPQNKGFREWATFRAFMVNLEQTIRRDHHLGPDAVVTREQIYALGGPPLRTLRRIMQETHGLLPDQWPPSTWPPDLPRKP